MTIDDVLLDHLGGFVYRIRPKTAPEGTEDLPLAEVRLPPDLAAQPVEVAAILRDRVSLDLDEIYDRGMFAGREDDEQLQAMRAQLDRWAGSEPGDT